MKTAKAEANRTRWGTFLAALDGSDLDPRASEQAAERVAHLIERGDDDQVAKTLRHLTTAARNARDGRPSRRQARKLIRFAASCIDFAELARRATAFRGDHNRAVRRETESRERALEREVRIDEDHCVREVRTVTHLRSVGRTLRNCLAGRTGALYREELRGGEAEFWVVRRRDQIVGVLSVETDTRVVGELAGPDDDDLDLPPETMDAILIGIDARIDDADEGRAGWVGAIAVGACVLVVGLAAYGIWRIASRGS